MKKLFIVLGMLLCAGVLFCSENSAMFNSDAGSYSRVSYYLDNNFSSLSLKFKNINQVAADIDNLSFDQKADLYEEYSKSGALYFGLNMLFPGLGSFIQGDTFGGVLCLGEYILGNGMVIGGIIGIAEGTAAAINTAINNTYSSSAKYESDAASKIGGSVCVLLVGGVLLIVDFVTCIVRPFTFSRNINNGLQNLLNADYVRLSFVPAITPNPDELGMTMGLTVKF